MDRDREFQVISIQANRTSRATPGLGDTTPVVMDLLEP